MDQMNVMVLVPNFCKSSPVMGAFLFARFLHQQKINVTFVSLDDNYGINQTICKEIESSGVPSACLNIKGLKGLVLRGRRFTKFCRQKQFSVVVAYLFRPTLITAFFTKIRKIVFVRGMLEEDYAMKYGKLIAKLMNSAEGLAIKRMDMVFSLTSDMRNWLVSKGIKKKKIFIFRNCIDAKALDLQIKDLEPSGDGQIHMGIFSSLIPRKSIHTAVEATALLVHQYHQNVVLHIAGEGPLFKHLKAMTEKLGVEERVLFHGFLKKPFPLMEKMHLVLLTSRSEGLPRCLMEAMYIGKTILAADIHGIRELIFPGKTGFLFTVGDAGEMAEQINQIIKANIFLPKRQLRSFIQTNYDIQFQGRQMLSQIKVLHDKGCC